MFGSKATVFQNCLPQEVIKHLNCIEGTRMTTLADAAILAATQLLQQMPTPGPKRIMFILNTDGEAGDSREAAVSFNTRFDLLCLAYPMTTSRTFVMGIGKNHDEKVLAALCVGKSSYYNYPDNELLTMIDAVDTISAEFKANNEVTLNPSGKKVEVTTVDDNLILDGVEVSLTDVSLTLPNGLTIPLVFETIDPTNNLFIRLKLQLLKKNTLELIQHIKSFTSSTGDKSKLLQLFTSKKDLLGVEFKNLSSFNKKNSIANMTLGDMIKSARARGATPEECRQMVSFKIKTLSTTIKQNLSDDFSATSAAIKLCQTCLECLRLGNKLSTELNRDCMEISGSGGFKHWTSKKIEKVQARAVKQCDPDSVDKAYAKMNKYFQDTMPETDVIDSRRVECFWNLSSALELATEKDVTILVGNINRGDRKLGYGSVNSCYVIETALVNCGISVCLFPMSFRVFMGILSQKQQISRGPAGLPLNSMIGFLPDLNSPHSIAIAKLMSPLLSSQLVTTNFTSTVGTMEYKNAALIALLAITNTHAFSEISCDTLQLGLDSFYFYNLGTNYLKDVLERAVKFHAGATTSGDVAAFSLAIADQMLLLAHRRVGKKAADLLTHIKLEGSNNVFDVNVPAGNIASPRFWRQLFLRLARDEMGKIFKPFGAAEGPEGDALRTEKQKEANLFTQLLSEGMNSVEMSLPFVFDSELLNYQPLAQVAPPALPDFDEFEFDDYEEEVEDSVENKQPVFAQRKDAVVLLLPQQTTTSGFIHCALHLSSTFPEKNPGEPFVPSSSLSTFQGLFLVHFLKRLNPEIQLMMCCYNHLQHQTSTGEPIIQARSLFSILGFEDNHDDGWRYLFEQCLLAIMYKENSVYNTNLLKPESILRLPVLTVLNTVSRGYWVKRENERIQEERREESKRLKNLKQIYTQLLYQHPLKLGFPLRICSLSHLQEINLFVKRQFGFNIELSVHPETKQITGMATNTFMCPRSDFFLQSVNSLSVCNAIYGPPTDRSELFLDHLHATASKIFIQTAGLLETTLTRYEKFEGLFYGEYEHVKGNSIPVKLFASLRISEEMSTASSFNIETITAAVLEDCPESVHRQLLENIPDEFIWQTEPVVYITNYYNDAFRETLSLVDFLQHLTELKGSLLTKDENSAAQLAFDEPLNLLKKEKSVDPNENTTMAEIVAIKKKTKDAKAARRAEKTA